MINLDNVCRIDYSPKHTISKDDKDRVDPIGTVIQSKITFYYNLPSYNETEGNSDIEQNWWRGAQADKLWELVQASAQTLERV
jgi:hypothetical protein